MWTICIYAYVCGCVWVCVCMRVHTHARTRSRVALEMGNLLKCQIVVALVLGIIAWNMDQAFSPETIL